MYAHEFVIFLTLELQDSLRVDVAEMYFRGLVNCTRR